MELTEQTGVSDKFIFTGIVPYEEVSKYINASDVCVHLPFGKRNERVGASSLKLFEYMACGKPIITTDVDGIPKEIERVNAGILVSCNLQEIAGNIIKLLKSEKMREEMGKNGRKCVVENHSWGIVAEKVARVCENVIKQRKYR
jgi:glycosyltransferase involved in cell wall biosynthesis